MYILKTYDFVWIIHPLKTFYTKCDVNRQNTKITLEKIKITN